MRLLVFTQTVDMNDFALGFFHSWIEEFSKHFVSIEVVGLEVKNYAFPDNVHVKSLGKESGKSRLKYVYRLFKYSWQDRKSYDSVFVHMNQEYVLLVGWLWRLLGKKVYMWRNYHYGNLLTSIAAHISNKVLCTSASSYTARFKNVEFMPVGVDTNLFAVNHEVIRKAESVLSFGRISPDKRLGILIDAYDKLSKQAEVGSLDIYGDELPKGFNYLRDLKVRIRDLGISDRVCFYPAVSQHLAPTIYQSHDVFVNLSPSGMYDKAIFEASACGCVVITSSKDWAAIADPMLVFDGSVEGLYLKLVSIINASEEKKDQLRRHCSELAQTQSLQELGRCLATLIN